MQVRHNVFETNSSSSHSLTIGYDCPQQALIPRSVAELGIITVKLEDHYSESEYSDFYSKLNYLLSWISETPEVNYSIVTDIVEELTGCIVSINGSGSTDGYGDVVFPPIIGNKDEIIAFLVNVDSTIVIHNDNEYDYDYYEDYLGDR